MKRAVVKEQNSKGVLLKYGRTPLIIILILVYNYCSACNASTCSNGREVALAISYTEMSMLKRRLAAMLAFASPSAMPSRLSSNKRASISIYSRLTFVSSFK